MGLDIYAGTLTRYYSHNWKTVVQQWAEDNEKPYYTDKPDWDAFGAMLLVAACHTYGEPVPPTVEKDWIFMEHPVIARLAADRMVFASGNHLVASHYRQLYVSRPLANR